MKELRIDILLVSTNPTFVDISNNIKANDSKT